MVIVDSNYSIPWQTVLKCRSRQLIGLGHCAPEPTQTSACDPSPDDGDNLSRSFSLEMTTSRSRTAGQPYRWERRVWTRVQRGKCSPLWVSRRSDCRRLGRCNWMLGRRHSLVGHARPSLRCQRVSPFALGLVYKSIPRMRPVSEEGLLLATRRKFLR